MIDIATSIRRQKRVPGVVGVIDGTHIRITNLPGQDGDFINRKGYPSVQLQLVVDDHMIINDAFVGWPGSTHDARVLRNSEFYTSAAQRIPEGMYIIGDSAYPLQPWLMTPFRDMGNLPQAQRHYNRVISSTRQSC
ncbi:putative nuclease HARBI1 [Ptychodera flava]|uniref:putative nuclease HARBI1 n=1 Tax=Ptychodera flava TaxID=63121 RepID=UPI00396A90B6